MSYIDSGDYNWVTGGLYSQTRAGGYWSSSISSGANSRSLNIYDTRLLEAANDNKLFGFALRCVTNWHIVTRYFSDICPKNK